MVATVTEVLGPEDGLFSIDETATFTVIFSDPVEVTGTPYLELSNGARAVYSGPTDATTLTFSYTVLEGAAFNTPDLEVEATELALDDGSIKDELGEDADLTIAGTDPGEAAAVDATRPTLEISSTSTFAIGQTVSLTFAFSEAVTDFDALAIIADGITLDPTKFVTLSDSLYTIEGVVFGNVSLGVLDDSFDDIAGNGGLGDTLAKVAGDTIVGTLKNDKVDLSASARKYHFQSTDGDDFIQTRKGNDIIKAGGGDDLIDAGVGIDKISAGQGNDTIRVRGKEAVHDKMNGGLDKDTLELVGNEDPITLSGFIATKSSIEVLVTNGLQISGKPGANKFDFRCVEVKGTLIVNGGGGADRIIGSDFADDLRGGDARDVLTGWKGNDILRGGRHGDVFVFGKECGDDTITDFGDRPNDQDIIKLAGFGDVLASEFGAWKSEHVTTDLISGDVIIRLGELQEDPVTGELQQDTITLSGFKDLGKISFDDFFFA